MTEIEAQTRWRVLRPRLISVLGDDRAQSRVHHVRRSVCACDGKATLTVNLGIRLLAYHHATLSQCATVDTQASDRGLHVVDLHDTAARQAIAQICTYFNQAAPLHHEDEEQDFFPALLRHAPQAQTDVDTLEAQHITLHADWAALHAQLQELLEGSRTTLNETLLHRFTSGYDVHTAIEEPLFELGRKAIPQAERQAIGKIMAARRQPKPQPSGN